MKHPYPYFMTPYLGGKLADLSDSAGCALLEATEKKWGKYKRWGAHGRKRNPDIYMERNFMINEAV